MPTLMPYIKTVSPFSRITITKHNKINEIKDLQTRMKEYYGVSGGLLEAKNLIDSIQASQEREIADQLERDKNSIKNFITNYDLKTVRSVLDALEADKEDIPF